MGGKSLRAGEIDILERVRMWSSSSLVVDEKRGGWAFQDGGQSREEVNPERRSICSGGQYTKADNLERRTILERRSIRSGGQFKKAENLEGQTIQKGG